MLKTEEEARKLWCPFARMTQAERAAPAANRVEGDHVKKGGGHLQVGCQCIASQCMAWRWSDHPERETRRLYKGETEVDDEPVTRAGNWRVISGEKWLYEYSDVDQKGEFELVHRAAPEDSPKHGWCGLAGKPNQ